MELIQEYLSLVIDIVSPKEISEKVYFAEFSKEHNRKVTRMRKIAAVIDQKYPELKREFCKMLSHENAGIRVWVAHHVLEVMNCDKSSKKQLYAKSAMSPKLIKRQMVLEKKCG